jgi:hypothetical protein
MKKNPKELQEEYKIKTTEQLQSVIDKRNTHNEKNTQTQRDRNTTDDMDKVREDGNDDDETGYSEDDHAEDEDGVVSYSKRRQAHSFYFTTEAVKRMESKEDGSLTVTCQVGGHTQCNSRTFTGSMMIKVHGSHTHLYLKPKKSD